jgi:gas vesicle protein
MKDESLSPNNNLLGVLTGLLIGGLAGATTMLLMAPQSGENTRKQIQKKSIELRDQTNRIVEDTLNQARLQARKITLNSRKKFKAFKHQGQELAIEQLDNAAAVVKAGKTAVKSF